MKVALVVILVVIASASAARIFNSKLDSHWEAYKQQHNKLYDEKEEIVRRFKWERNLKYIEKHNKLFAAGKHTYWLAMNKYGDMTIEEFRQQMNGFRKTNATNILKGKSSVYTPLSENVPTSVDWRTQGYVTPVKDQGQCGSCWSFSATGSLEGQWFKKNGKLVSLSEQNLVDCSGAFGNMGCNGGLMDQAFAYIKSNNGLDTEASYEYEAQDGVCRFNSANVGATDTGYTDIASGSESELTNAIANVGPISVAIDAGHISFQLYGGGVYYEPECSPTQLDHGVLAVGYNTDASGQDYYIVKNSWGQSWGTNGYILMSRNKNNNCGIATMSSYPLV